MSDEKQQAIVRVSDGIGGSLEAMPETSTAAAAARETGKIQARAVVAMQHPRDLDTVRIKLLKEAERPGFAAVSRYRIKRGKKNVGGHWVDNYIEGPTIRLAEAVIRFLGNLDVSLDVIYDAPERRIVRVGVLDIETNNSYSTDIAIDKLVERRELREGETAVSVRQNSEGRAVYVVLADEATMQNKTNLNASKARRNAALALLPGDILDEVMQRCLQTMADTDAKDPDAARKRLADSFASVGVMPDALKSYGVDLSACSPAQLAELRAIYAGISTGEATWAEVLDEKQKVAAGETTATPKVDALKARLAERGKGKAHTTTPQHDPVTGEVVPAVEREPGAEG